MIFHYTRADVLPCAFAAPASARTPLANAAHGPSAINAAVSIRRIRSMGPTRSRRVAAQAHGKTSALITVNCRHLL